MIGIDNPENGHIGYLAYEKVDKITIRAAEMLPLLFYITILT